MKSFFIASSGGHWEELMCFNEIASKHDTIYITETGGQAKDSSIKNLHTVPQMNRREKNFTWHFFKLFVDAARITFKEKPKFVISTGALIAFPFCFCAKLIGAKVVYVESFARVYSKSLTGRLIYPLADLFLVQWEPMLKLYPKAKYVGGIF